MTDMQTSFAPFDSTAIYPKPGHKLLYTPMTGKMKCPIGYTFALRISFHLLNVDATHAPT